MALKGTAYHRLPPDQQTFSGAALGWASEAGERWQANASRRGVGAEPCHRICPTGLRWPLWIAVRPVARRSPPFPPAGTTGA